MYARKTNRNFLWWMQVVLPKRLHVYFCIEGNQRGASYKFFIAQWYGNADLCIRWQVRFLRCLILFLQQCAPCSTILVLQHGLLLRPWAAWAAAAPWASSSIHIYPAYNYIREVACLDTNTSTRRRLVAGIFVPTKLFCSGWNDFCFPF